MSNPAPVLIVEQLRARMPGRDDIVFGELELQAGEMAIVRGASGAGKSTLLHLLAGVFPVVAPAQVPKSPQTAIVGSGRARVGGIELQGLSRHAREQLRPTPVGWMPQRHLAMQSLNVLDNVLLPLALVGRVTPAARAAALTWLEALDVAPLADRMPATLSLGQLARVCLARSVVAAPALLLVDEPTAALDEASGERVARCLLRCAANGIAVVIASHDERLQQRIEAGARTLRRLELLP